MKLLLPALAPEGDAYVYALGLAFGLPIVVFASAPFIELLALAKESSLLVVCPLVIGLVLAFAPERAHVRKAAALLAVPLFYLWLQEVHREQMLMDAVAFLR